VSLQLGRRDPAGDLLGRPEVTQRIGMAQVRRDPGLLGVPQDPLKQTDLCDCPLEGLRRPERDEQWRLCR
jgi:hypothetical protein